VAGQGPKCPLGPGWCLQTGPRLARVIGFASRAATSSCGQLSLGA
jgi:hypothetical protein